MGGEKETEGGREKATRRGCQGERTTDADGTAKTRSKTFAVTH